MPTSKADAGDLYLLDGNSLVFRAFFALPIDLATKAGQVTNAVHGFTSMLVMLLRDNEPGGMAVAFDRPEPTFRDEIVEEYKGNRPETPDLLVPQFALVREVLGALGIVMVEKAGYEADDILATLATQARDAGRNVVVVSGDRDTFQLVEDPLRQGHVHAAGALRHRRLRRGRDRRAPRGAARARTPSSPRCAATPPTTCRACPGWGRRPPPSS